MIHVVLASKSNDVKAHKPVPSTLLFYPLVSTIELYGFSLPVFHILWEFLIWQPIIIILTFTMQGITEFHLTT